MRVRPGNPAPMTEIVALTEKVFGRRSLSTEADLGKHDGILNGVLADVNFSSEFYDEDVALAVLLVREWANQHGCTRKKMSDQLCTHRDHYRDVTTARILLWSLGLPCGTEWIPLGDAVRLHATKRSDVGPGEERTSR